MPKTLLTVAGALSALLVAGCPRAIYVRDHHFSVTDIRESAAEELKRELRASGYRVAVDSVATKGETLGDPITDQWLAIASADYTDVDVRKVTAIVTSGRRKDPIVIRSTDVVQRYVSASGEGTASVELTVELTQNATAYYKATGAQVQLRSSTYLTGQPGQQTATFSYRRRAREEYVDIYIVPEYSPAGFKPKSFLRISLSYPYAAQRMPWESCWTRFWKWVGSIFRKPDAAGD